MTKYPMTAQGAQALREELTRLKTEVRAKITTAISEARAHGDLKENAEYHAAREQQSFNEGKIRDLEAKLSNAQIVDISKIENNGKVIFGSTVTVFNLETEQETTYKIVGEDEADIKGNTISYSSPIGRALIAKFVGDTVIVDAPGGKIEYEILSVDY